MNFIGNLFVVAAPSGSGKTTLVNELVEIEKQIIVSISYTTRPKRGNEQHGINYFFVDQLTFDQMIINKSFLEYAKIFNHYYGTAKQDIEKMLLDGTDVILEIDWQGHQQIKKIYPKAIGIFILPPSYSVLKQRLIKRNQDNPMIIKQRLLDAKETVSHIRLFDYVVVNDDFDKTLSEMQCIV